MRPKRWLAALVFALLVGLSPGPARALDYCHLARTCSYCYFAIIPCLYQWVMGTADP
jgi:hypothetical protein